METDSSSRRGEGASPLVSVVIPAYQEEGRVGDTIRALCWYLDGAFPGAEVLVVCDGCTDRTAETAKAAFCARTSTLRVIEVPRNRGKGHAVRVGVQQAAGQYILFTDADLSFAPELIKPFLERLAGGADIVIAQRRPTTTYQGIRRRLLGTLSRLVVGWLVLPGIPDSQAGFKAFTRNTASDLFGRLRVDRFLFDLEILVMARQKRYRIDTIEVDWRDRPGSTVRVVVDSLRSLRDLAAISLRRAAGRYRP